MSRFALFGMAFMAAAVMSCKQKASSVADSMELDNTQEVTSLDEYIQDVDIIHLQGDLIPGVTKVLSTSEGYVTVGGQINRYDKKGKPLGQIGRPGRGPGEYLSVRDVCLNPEGTEVLVLTPRNEIIRYSLSDGSFISKTETEIKDNTADAILPLPDNKVALYFANPAGEDVSNFDKEFNCLKYINKDGKIVGEAVPRSDFNISMGFKPVCFQNKGNSYLLSFGPSSGDFYTVKGDEVVPCGKIDLGAKALPARFAIRGKDNPMQYFENIFEDNYLKCPSSVLITDDVFYCSAFGKESSVWNFVMDKNGEKGIKWQSVGEMVMPMSGVAADKDYIYFSYAEPGIDSSSETKDILKKYLIDKCGLVIPENGNPVIVRIKFKI